jgi:galactokinase/mevalonate kinase-like predicted kinase
MTKAERSRYASWLGKQSYSARVKRLGIEKLQEIARENGKLGGRPKGTGKKKANPKPQPRGTKRTIRG